MRPHLRLLTPILTLILILGAHQQLRAQSIGYFLYATDQGLGPRLEGSTENATYKPKKAVEVLSFAFAGTKSVSFTGGSAAAEFNPLELVIQDDPNILGGLMLKMAAGNHYNDLVLEGAITGAGGGGGNEVVFRLELKKVYVSAVNLSGTDGDRSIYNLSLEWGAMQITTWKRLPNGTLEEVPPVSWSRVLNNNTFGV